MIPQFDRFLAQNKLQPLIESEPGDSHLANAFLRADLPVRTGAPGAG